MGVGNRRENTSVGVVIGLFLYKWSLKHLSGYMYLQLHNFYGTQEDTEVVMIITAMRMNEVI